MRYYRIEITDSNGKYIKDATGKDIGPWDSEKNPLNPATRPGAPLQITIDAPTFGSDMLAGGAMLTVFGLPVSVLRQAVNLHLANITVYGGFVAGLPLANPAQKNVILKGQIYSPYGNWQGVYQTLNLPVWPSNIVDDLGQPFTITMDGKKGDKLSDVILKSLQITYQNSAQKMEINVNIHQNLVLYEDWPAIFSSIFEMSQMLKRVTPGMLGQRTYSGVNIVVQKNKINVFDSSDGKKAKPIEAKDLIGQPTWLEPQRISIKTSMRADIEVGDWITLPFDAIGQNSILAVGNQMGQYSEKQRLSFSGTYEVMGMRHIGDYYNVSEDGWVTVFEAVPRLKDVVDR